jgi:hypothetical protein
MSGIYYAITIGLPVWWAAQTILFLRDYARQRNASKTRLPMTEEQKAEIAKLESELPRKELHPLGWYARRPKECARVGAAVLIHLPFVIIFLPIAVLIWVLPWDHHRR